VRVRPCRLPSDRWWRTAWSRRAGICAPDGKRQGLTLAGAPVKPSDPARGATYGDMSQMPEAFLKGFEQALAANPAQDPKDVATAIVELVALPRGERPFRTVVDKMGMGGHVAGYNDHLDKVTTGIYTAFGISHLMKIKP
jgi:hypothetical protein